MNQTRLESLLESSTHMITGAGVSMLVWIFIISPLYGFSQSMTQNLTITLIFSGASMIRGYLLRRCFNAGLHKVIHKLAKKIFSLKNFSLKKFSLKKFSLKKFLLKYNTK